MTTTLLLILHATGLVTSVLGFTDVCYGILGCFSNSQTYSNSHNNLPLRPDLLDVKHHIYSSNDPDNYQGLKYDDNDAVRNLINIDPTRPLKILVHGFKAEIEEKWMHDLKNAILIADPEVNVYLVGWSKGARFPFYYQSVANVRVVAAEVKLILDQFASEGLSMEDVHMIGHSLGAHVSGEVGRHLDGHIGRITGLDPASPGFDGYSDEVRLDKSDAQYVDVIHTDAVKDGSRDLLKKITCGGLGSYRPFGHTDVYVNGGRDQPGCGTFWKTACEWSRNIFKRRKRSVVGELSCSHKRVTQLFIESVNSDCPFTVYKCDRYEDFISGACVTCPREGCNVMGYKSSKSKQLGVSFVQTSDASPYCGHSYGVIMQPRTYTDGTMQISLSGSKGITDMMGLSDDRSRFRGAVFSRVDPGVITSVTALYDREWSWFGGSRSLDVKSITINNGEYKQKLKFCFRRLRLIRGHFMAISLLGRSEC